MARAAAASEGTLQKLLNEAIRSRQYLNQLVGIQESLLRIQMENNLLLRRLAGVHTGELAIIKAQQQAHGWGPDRPTV